jgi:hypothetical protein
MVVDPAIPACAAITLFCPIFTLWAIWIRLSILVPFPIMVEPIVALSILQFEPISTSSSMITFPKLRNFLNPSAVG